MCSPPLLCVVLLLILGIVQQTVQLLIPKEGRGSYTARYVTGDRSQEPREFYTHQASLHTTFTFYVWSKVSELWYLLIFYRIIIKNTTNVLLYLKNYITPFILYNSFSESGRRKTKGFHL